MNSGSLNELILYANSINELILYANNLNELNVHTSNCVMLQVLGQLKDSQPDTEVLMSALTAMQDKTVHLENSLSAETRLKLDLFSALGEAKRQMEILQSRATAVLILVFKE